MHLALVGDYSTEVAAHRAIPRALALARAAVKSELTWTWVQSRDVRAADVDLSPYSAVWAVPGSPYENMAGVLDAIRWARESGRPFLGTCGGFQHALIEFGRNVAGIAAADHAESNPAAAEPLVTELPCSLGGKGGAVHFAPDSRIAAAYGRAGSEEEYRCSYGLNPAYAAALAQAGLRYTAWDADGAVRAAELPAHPFFVGTLFQPERAALRDQLPPLLLAFVQAAIT